jgi:hypothetical protein
MATPRNADDSLRLTEARMNLVAEAHESPTARELTDARRLAASKPTAGECDLRDAEAFHALRQAERDA